jgi:hypothetical protein
MRLADEHVQVVDDGLELFCERVSDEQIVKSVCQRTLDLIKTICGSHG